MFRDKANIPEQPKVPPMPNMAEDIDRLYLEKCQEVNELEKKAENFKKMAEIAVRQKQELAKQLEEMKKEAQAGDLIRRQDALKAVDAANSTIVVLPEMQGGWNEGILSQITERHKRALELINEIPAVSANATIRELVGECLKFDFTPNVEPPEELPESLMEELPVWTLQTVSSQDILCLSSALKNLYDAKELLLADKLAKITEKAIDNYCSEE